MRSTPTPRPLRRLPRLIAATTLALLLVAAAAPTASAAGEQPLAASCSYNTSRLLGWVWSDGNYNAEKGHFFFRTLNDNISRHLTEILDDLDLWYRTGTSRKGHDNFRIRIPGYDGSFLDADPEFDPFVRCNRRAFLASVIEGEGTQAGKVFDDPRWLERDSVIDMLDVVGVDASHLRQNVMADQADWPRFSSFPFVACGRVPGGTAYCTPG